jgi:hypothetical protein
MSPLADAGNWYLYGVLEIVSLRPLESATQQLPEVKGLITLRPWLAL